MKNNDHSESISFGINLITFGIIALFVTLGLTTWQYILEFFLTYWPIFIVLAGIKIVLSAVTKGNSIASVIFDFIVAIALLVAISVPAVKNITSLIQSSVQNASQEGAHERVIDIKPQSENIAYQMTIGAATFVVTDAQSVSAFKATSSNGSMAVSDSYNAATFLHSITFDNANAEIRFQPALTTMKRVYTLETNNRIPAMYSFKVGASSGTGTFTSAPISDFRLDLGAGDMNITFTDATLPKNMTVSVGAGSTTIRIPRSKSVQVNYNVGAGDFSFDKESFGGLAKKGTYTHTGLNDTTVSINLQVGAGNVSIVTY